MVATQRGRYSKYIRPISVILDLFIMSFLACIFFKNNNLDILIYLNYQAVIWLLISAFVGFYNVYRFTTPVEIFSKIVKHFLVFILAIIAFYPFSKNATFNLNNIIWFIILSFLLIVLIKYVLFFYLKKYRIITGSNYRNAIIIGHSLEAKKLKDLFQTRLDYGYRFFGFFSDKKTSPEIVGKIDDIKEFVIENKIDEIYCSLNEVTNEQLKALVEFSDENKVNIKFIPDTKQIFSKNLKINYYETFPVLTLQRTLLHEPRIKVFKRIFDILFSLIVIGFFLSWLIPIIAMLIKLESKGPVFFKQGRPGLNEQEFFCLKFRSMHVNKKTETLASKNDPRVTIIGKFLRKTSLDEMPQFFNVLYGDMSVVGPRPHLWSQNKSYGSRIKKYMVRHYVKPGITGLAQVKGYRGEIETDEDMINRIKLDVHYIENWSFLQDLKIILQTIINIFKGEEKAY